MSLRCCHTQGYLVLSADISDELSHLDTLNSCLPMSLVYCHTQVYLVLSADISDELPNLDTHNSCLLMSLLYCHTQVYIVPSADFSDKLSHLDTPNSCLLNLCFSCIFRPRCTLCYQLTSQMNCRTKHTLYLSIIRSIHTSTDLDSHLHIIWYLYTYISGEL